MTEASFYTVKVGISISLISLYKDLEDKWGVKGVSSLEKAAHKGEGTSMFKRLREDIEVVFEQDPAARSYFEVILTYSGLHAVWAHRIAHAFYKKNFFLLHVGFHKLVGFYWH